jgi:AcrR family transcriptional regulator
MARAAGRGRYDRGLSPEARAADQRRAILLATAAVLDENGPTGVTVDVIVPLARVGRSTFYAHFDDVRQVLAELETFACAEIFAGVEQEAAAARTPLERVRAAVQSFLSRVEVEPLLSRVALGRIAGVDPRRHVSVAASRWASILVGTAQAARRDGLFFQRMDRVRLEAVASMLCAVGLRVAVNEVPAGPASELLVDVVVRTLR